MEEQSGDYKVLKPFAKGMFRNLVDNVSKKNKVYVGKFYSTKRDGLVEVIELINYRSVKVRFINSGFEREVLLANLAVGKCADTTIEVRPSTIVTTYPNVKIQSNSCGEFTIVERTGKFCKVLFTETGYETQAYTENARKGKVTDPYFKSRYGIGYLGEDVDCSYREFAYTLWGNMIKRCYSKTDSRGYFGKGKNVFVNDRWLCFHNFAKDIPNLPNFDKWLNGQMGKSDTKYNLDKDFAYVGCNEYSLETCQFIDESLNKSTTCRNPNSAINIARHNQSRGDQ